MSASLDLFRSIRCYLKNESFSCHPLVNGCVSQLLHVKTDSGSQYVLRVIPHVSEEKFDLEIKIQQIVYNLGFGPQIYVSDLSTRSMLLEFVANQQWPEFSSNPEPYKRTMIALRQIHASLPHIRKDEVNFLPFSFIESSYGYLSDRTLWLPNQLSSAIDKTRKMFLKLKPWLQKNAVLCHGDFHKGNVLFGEKIAIIDWSDGSIGHPFFDIAKFSISLNKKERLELLSFYLGRDPTKDEIEDFMAIDSALLIVIVNNRFTLALEEMQQDNDIYKKEELEKLLLDPLPSFLSVSFNDRSTRTRQYGAICALKEFQNKVEMLPSG